MLLPITGIPPHVDTHSAFEDTILSLSLGTKVGIYEALKGQLLWMISMCLLFNSFLLFVYNVFSCISIMSGSV